MVKDFTAFLHRGFSLGVAGSGHQLGWCYGNAFV